MKLTSHAVRSMRTAWRWTLSALLIGFLLTGISTFATLKDARERDAARFASLAYDDWERLETAVERYESALMRLRDLFEGGRVVSMREWWHQLEVIDPQGNYPALLEMGYAPQRHSWKSGLPPDVILKNDPRPEPTNKNQAMFVTFPTIYRWRVEETPPGEYEEDLVNFPGLGDALTRAYQTTKFAMTSPRLLWANGTNRITGVTMLFATYKTNLVEITSGWLRPSDLETTARHRAANTEGAVFMSFRPDDLIEKTFGLEPREVALEIFDGKTPLEEKRWNAFPPKWLKTSSDWKGHGAFIREMEVKNYGEKLLVRAHSTPWFERQSQRGRAWLVAAAGSAISLAIAGLFLVQIRGRAAAEAWAQELSESRELLRRATAEREGLSRDLHDGTVQSLYAVGLGLSRCRKSLAGTAQGDQLEVGLVELDNVIAELRGYLAKLDPGISPAQSAAAALEQVLERLRRTTTANIRLKSTAGAGDRLPPAAVLDLLQVAREGISNALRHGKAESVEVVLTQDAGVLKLVIADNGCGFQPGISSSQSCQGLLNLEHRARTWKGTIEVNSKPGGPSVLQFTMPIHESA